MQQPGTRQILIQAEPTQSSTYPLRNDNLSLTSSLPSTSATGTNAPAAAAAPEPMSPAGMMACLCCTGTVVLLFGICAAAMSLFSIIIPILQMVFGKKYENQCPAEPSIPYYLYLVGILGIFPCILTIATTCAASFISTETKKDSKVLWLVSLILRVVSALAQLLLIIFLIYLIYITFGIYGKVQYIRTEDEKTYCHKTLYQFTLFICVINIISAFILCCCGSAAPEKKKKPAANV